MRWKGLVALPVLVGIGLLSQGLPDLLGEVVSTALYATLVQVGFWTLSTRVNMERASWISLAWCWLLELAQLTTIPRQISGLHPLLRLIFGTSFDAKDLPAYLLGVLPLWWWFRRRGAHATPPPPGL
ncbi:MAG TPA: DUF2809 domain-containing protein [Myxococcota bacterium]|nr:DUF2809 domain-containing protein [Myxococcota bacterium]